MLAYMVIFELEDKINFIIINCKEAFEELMKQAPKESEKVLFSGEILLSEVETKYLSYFII